MVEWMPTNEVVKASRLYQWYTHLGYSNYETFLKASTNDISWFWGKAEQAVGISWFHPYSQVLKMEDGPKWPQWFVNGTLNIVHDTVEKWANEDATSKNRAIIWESEDGEIQTYSFEELNGVICRVANGFKKLGIQKKDVIAIYMPMVPETVIAMLASIKIGAIFTPIFSGFGFEAVATRLQSSQAKLLITSDGFLRKGKIVPMKEEADKAVEMSPSIEKVVVFHRFGRKTVENDREIDWRELVNESLLSLTEQMNSSDPMMLIYTSGTTGKPKGTVHTHAGFPIKASFDAGICMDVKKGDTLFWYTDMGWMMGPFLVFGGLINGASIVLYEGTPDFPEPDQIWKLVSSHKVTHLGISPTLVRSLMQHGSEWPDKHDISSLRVIGSTGEPWNLEPWLWLFEKVGKSRIPIFNYSGGTEISGGILGNVLLRSIKPMTFNSPLPGMDVDVFSNEEKSVIGEVGELVIKQPWVGMTNGFWNEPARYEEAYWSRWKDTWVHGDWVIKDKDGYWTITGRSDDTLNIAGKRVGPAEIETILVSHPNVVEAAAIGVPDDLKGEAIACFVVLNAVNQLSIQEHKQQLINLVIDKMGKSLKPKVIHFVSALPKTRNAKVMRRVIRAAFLHLPKGDLSSLENPQVVEEIAILKENN